MVRTRAHSPTKARDTKRVGPAAKAPGRAARGRAIREVKSRYIGRAAEVTLWGRAAGRCEFDGCNKALWKSSVTQEPVNIGQKAHIYAFSSDGPRGHRGVATRRLNNFENLMLVCHECHRKIDKKKDGGRYTAQLLRMWKAAHERRTEIVTGIAVSKRSQVLLYGANIGDHSSPLQFADAAPALFPDRYPATDVAIVLGTVNSSFVDRDVRFWSVEAANLRTQFDRRVRDPLSIGGIEHLSVFALAPQPLLVLLGSLLGDIVPADVFQRHREPPTWAWPAAASPATLLIKEPSTFGQPPALILAYSATVTVDRITAALGCAASVWTVTTPNPDNDCVKSRQQLQEFRAAVRPLLDRIKAVHGQTTPLHVFPAAPVSVAVEFGRIRMPKADAPWRIYDQVNARGGFLHALTIDEGT